MTELVIRHEQVRVSEGLTSPFKSGLDRAEVQDGRMVQSDDWQRGQKLRDECRIVLEGSGLLRAIGKFGRGNSGRHHSVIRVGSPRNNMGVAAQDLDAGVGVEHLHRSTVRPPERAA